jgi:hypothetical protein
VEYGNTVTYAYFTIKCWPQLLVKYACVTDIPALANKLARIAWAMMSTGESFRTELYTKEYQGIREYGNTVTHAYFTINMGRSY